MAVEVCASFGGWKCHASSLCIPPAALSLPGGLAPRPSRSCALKNAGWCSYSVGFRSSPMSLVQTSALSPAALNSRRPLKWGDYLRFSTPELVNKKGHGIVKRRSFIVAADSRSRNSIDFAAGEFYPLVSRGTSCNCASRDLDLGRHQVLEEPWERMVGVSSSSKQKEERPDASQRSRQTGHQKLSLKAQAMQQTQPFNSARPRNVSPEDVIQHRRTKVNCVPQSRDTPPMRDTGIASEKDWGITLKNEISSESGVNEDGSTWFRECGEDLGENGFRSRWTIMGGRSTDGSSEWKETWWEKSDWKGYKELGAEKSGKNDRGDSWWETWQEVLRQDDWSNLARIEKTAQKQAKLGSGEAGWYEKWWEKYNAKGWTEKGAHKYGRLSDQAWWEKWGEQYDGRGAVLKWTDKWAENAMGEKWGDKWEERFENGVGTRQGETWHASNNENWSRTWGEEHFGNGNVHKYGKSTSGESWDNVVTEITVYQAEPHYGWADAIGHSTQLLNIEPRPRPPGVYPDLDFGSSSKQ